MAIELQAEIDKNRLRIANAQQLMLDGKLSATDYREVKNRYSGSTIGYLMFIITINIITIIMTINDNYVIKKYLRQ